MLVIRELCMKFERWKWNSSHLIYILKIMQGIRYWGSLCMVSLVCWSCWLRAAPIPTSHPNPHQISPFSFSESWPSICAALWWRKLDSPAGHSCIALKLRVRDRHGFQLVHVGSSCPRGVRCVIVLIYIQLFFLTDVGLNIWTQKQQPA